jgi:hypothetical protein
MDLKISLIIVLGIAAAVCLGLIKMIGDLSQSNFHESPAIQEPPEPTEAQTSSAAASYLQADSKVSNIASS